MEDNRASERDLQILEFANKFNALIAEYQKQGFRFILGIQSPEGMLSVICDSCPVCSIEVLSSWVDDAGIEHLADEIFNKERMN